ncbi:MAG: hypothetical protein V3V08_20290 [Nannocystaceae bacterium]
MGEWQRNELAGTDVVYLIGMQTAGGPAVPAGTDEPPSVEALNAWVDELNFSATHLLLDDPSDSVLKLFIAANPTGEWSLAVTAIMDRGMKIRRVGDTYDSNHAANLGLLQELLDE